MSVVPDVIVMTNGRMLPMWLWPTHRFDGATPDGNRRYITRWHTP